MENSNNNNKIKNPIKSFRCKNCGKYGHKQNKCKLPIMSYGCIGVKVKNITLGRMHIPADKPPRFEMNDRIYFTMIRRCDSISYIEFIRGKYHLDNQDYIHLLFSRMTKEEIVKISTTENIDLLWNKIWNIKHPSKKLQSELNTSRYKFNKLRVGLIDHKTQCTLNLSQLITQYKDIVYDIPEWGFPKGRRNINESYKQTAIREFKEETDLKDVDFELLPIKPYNEQYIGSNNICYKHIYYIVQLDDNVDKLTVNPNNKHQIYEIGDTGLFTYREAIYLLRGYHIEKQKVITELFRVISNQLYIQDLA